MELRRRISSLRVNCSSSHFLFFYLLKLLDHDVLIVLWQTYDNKNSCFPGKETRWGPDDLPQQTAIRDEWQQRTSRGRAGGG